MPWRTKVPLVETRCSVASTRCQDTVKYHKTLSWAYVSYYTITILQKGKLSLRELSDTMATQWEKPRPVRLQSFCSFHMPLISVFYFKMSRIQVDITGQITNSQNQRQNPRHRPPASRRPSGFSKGAWLDP